MAWACAERRRRRAARLFRAAQRPGFFSSNHINIAEAAKGRTAQQTAPRGPGYRARSGAARRNRAERLDYEKSLEGSKTGRHARSESKREF